MERKPGYSDKIGLMLSGNVEVLRSLQADSCVLSQVSILIESICQSLQASSKLIVCGNGGFASQSNHVVAELRRKLYAKRNPYTVVPLCSDSSLLICITNDFGFDTFFSRRLRGIAKSEDVLVAFTTFGKLYWAAEKWRKGRAQ